MQISFFSFLGLHVLAGVFGWQIWPLTNYPMFSRSYPEFKEYKTIFVESVYPDRSIRWNRAMFNTGNPRDLRLLAYLNETADKKRLDSYLLSRAQKLYKTMPDPTALHVLRATFQIDSQNQKLIKTEQVIREIPFNTK